MSRGTPVVLSVLVIVVITANHVHGQQDRVNRRTIICRPFTLPQCEQVAQICLDLTLALSSHFRSQNAAIACAGRQGIGRLALWWARSDAKTPREILRDAGADDNARRDITRCVLTTEGWAVNNVLDVNKVKNAIRGVIKGGIRNSSQQRAALTAVDTCRNLTIDTMNDFVFCIAEACIKGTQQYEP